MGKHGVGSLCLPNSQDVIVKMTQNINKVDEHSKLIFDPWLGMKGVSCLVIPPMAKPTTEPFHIWASKFSQWISMKLVKVAQASWCLMVCTCTFLFSVWAQVIFWNTDEKFAQALHAFYQFVFVCELKGALLFFVCLCNFLKKWGGLHKASQSSKAFSWFLVCVLVWRSPFICVWMIF